MTASRSRWLSPRRILVAVIVTLALLAAWRFIVVRVPALPAPVDPRLPDLVMGPIEEVTGGLEEFTGNPVVRVEATIVNRGDGPFLVSARRDFPWSAHWTVFQGFVEASGGSSEQATAADLIFTGAPHSHWHVLNMEAHRLEDKASGKVLSEVIKQGFCPYDTDRAFPDRPGSPAEPAYVEADCEGPAWVTDLRMGVSVGWGDRYPWHMVEQSIEIGTIADGVYRISETADPFDWFRETDESNNDTWVDIRIDNASGIPHVTVVDRAPAE